MGHFEVDGTPRERGCRVTPVTQQGDE